MTDHKYSHNRIMYKLRETENIVFLFCAVMSIGILAVHFGNWMMGVLIYVTTEFLRSFRFENLLMNGDNHFY